VASFVGTLKLAQAEPESAPRAEPDAEPPCHSRATTGGQTWSKTVAPSHLFFQRVHDLG
jgi:hypothetical protein